MKKVLSLVLVIALVLSSFSFAFAAPKFEDVDGDYEDAINILVALGVVTGYEDGTYRPERVVTRAEMAKLIVEILGYGDLVAGSASNFADTQGHWADPWIALAAGRGLVIGTGDGNFTPDRTVSYDEAITMIVRALGYSDNSNELAGMTWPTNFKVKAAELGLTKNVALNAAGADRGGVAQLLFNALEEVLVTVNSDGDVVKSENELLSRLAELDEDFDVTAEILDPDNKNYAGDLVDLAPYMFQNLKVYLNDDDEVVFVKGSNSLVIEGVVDDIDGLVVEVEDANEKIQKATLEDEDIDADTVFENGALKESDIEIGDLEDTDTITIVANDENDNGKIDKGEVVGFVTTVQTDVIRIEQEYVDGKDKLDGLLLPDKVTVKGVVDALEDIEEDDIVVEYLSEDEEVTTLVVTRDVVEGEVTRLSGDDTIYVDGVKYSIADLSIIGDGYFSLGDEGLFFLNHDGDVVDFDGSETGPEDYAVVIGVADGDTAEDRFTDDLSVDKYPSLKLATQDDEVIIYDIEVDVDDEGVIEDSAEDEDGDTLITAGTVGEGEGTLVVDRSVVDEHYLIRYKLNKDGRISEIEFVKDLSDGDIYDEIDLNKSTNAFATDAVIFDATEGEDYPVVKEDVLPTKVEAYAVRNSNGQIEVLVAADGEVGSVNEIFVYIFDVDDARKDGDDVQFVELYTGGEEVGLYTTDDDTVWASDVEGVFAVKYDGDEIDSAVAVTPSSIVLASRVNARSNMIEIDGEWYALSEYGTVVIMDGEEEEDGLGDLYDITRNETRLRVYVNDDGDIDLILVLDDDAEDPEPEPDPATGVVTYINTEKTQMVIDGVIYRADEDTVVKDEDGNIVGLGNFDPIAVDDVVDVDGDVYQIVE